MVRCGVDALCLVLWSNWLWMWGVFVCIIDTFLTVLVCWCVCLYVFAFRCCTVPRIIVEDIDSASVIVCGAPESPGLSFSSPPLPTGAGGDSSDTALSAAIPPCMRPCPQCGDRRVSQVGRPVYALQIAQAGSGTASEQAPSQLYARPPSSASQLSQYGMSSVRPRTSGVHEAYTGVIADGGPTGELHFNTVDESGSPYSSYTVGSLACDTRYFIRLRVSCQAEVPTASMPCRRCAAAKRKQPASSGSGDEGAAANNAGDASDGGGMCGEDGVVGAVGAAGDGEAHGVGGSDVATVVEELVAYSAIVRVQTSRACTC